MKTNKKSLIGSLIFSLIFVGSVSAVGSNSNVNVQTQQNQQQVQVQNQGSEAQIQTQTKIQIEGTNQTDTGSNVQLQQNQQQLRDGSGEGNQVQVQNQGIESQVQNQEMQEPKQNKVSEVAQQRRSKVASAVQEMLQVADRNGGIGQQVRAIAQEQGQNSVQAEDNLEKIQSRNSFVKFLIGPNYGEINKTEKILEQNREKIEQLNQVKNQLSNEGDHQMLTQQIQILEQASLEIENALKQSQEGVSLLGWMFRFFSK